MKNKKILLIIAVLTLAVVASLILWLIFSNNSDNSTNVNQSNNDLKEIQKAEAPQNFDSNTIKEPSRETSYVYTDQVVSPDTVASNPDEYLNKKITVRGWIVEPTEGLYIITSINSSEQKALVLAKNDSINFGEYTNTSTDSSKTSTPVTLTGTFSSTESSGNIEFIVESLEH